MILLIDAGNTRIKWGVVDADRSIAEGTLGHEESAGFSRIAAEHRDLRRVFGANVAGPTVASDIARALAGLAPAPEWLTASAGSCGVRNRYDNPSQLGADRWAALIGARALYRCACLVVNAGTATTVDVLDADGDFQGGLILPGEDLMRRALAGNTAQLPFADGEFVRSPRNTADAIRSGCRHAQLGAIERMFREIESMPGARCVLSGGAAARLAGQLAIPCSPVDNLVLKGLAVITHEPAADDVGRPSRAAERTIHTRTEE
ncbi:MAG: type III pantothenate kinase [Aromatoleum sp.]|jgi:type III pantothenate kinase|uniref:type III pantothenate kinase n=1 Tax=Aromatoleum sp. TaxID=2307007 RepID=UPI0028943447|nr:type III pantothenate kinase [Aromatoleum sp.]MDT3670912.1 type III pantothenate kinase [Aromatoleum sp.]